MKTRPKKTYRVSEVASMFGYGSQWVRKKELESLFRDQQGSVIVPKRTDAVTGHRRYTIDQISEMAEALHRRRDISSQRYALVRKIVDDFIAIEAFKEKQTWYLEQQ